MANEITIKIDGNAVTVPAGTIVVDAAKRIGNDVPVFCYHPKMEPVGMCRVCLVEMGMPRVDRETRQPVLKADGTPEIDWMPKLVTGCTERVRPGMEIRTNSEKVKTARQEILEFLLTSHPLDCPICDKGGECPLQNLTIQHGPGNSRFLVNEKFHLDKHVPLGDLIYLDRERCIQCARCIRFQEDLADDPVLGFDERGRATQIVTFSEPGFDSYFSGNTTDICPVGALTTADFRFGARAWEMQNSASICNACPVGCNTHLNTRRDGLSGNFAIKRVMPRQNEQVNELWICDKGRFGHHFATSPDRLSVPQIRKKGQLVQATWDEALSLIAEKMQAAGSSIAGIAGERLANEDLFTFRKLIEGQGGKIAAFPGEMAGGDWVQQVGIAAGSNLSELGGDSVIVVVANDLEESAPIWWMRVHQAVEKKGATLDKSKASLIVLNARPTKAEGSANYAIHYAYGEETATVQALLRAAQGNSVENETLTAAGKAIANAKNLVVFLGNEGLDYADSAALAQACANLLIETGHVGKPNNGLIAVWNKGNTQGAWDMGLRPLAGTTANFVGKSKFIWTAAADPIGDKQTLPEDTFLVVSELFETATSRRADVVLPVQSFAEREGTYTSGERRVQRFYPAVPARGESRPDWLIFSHVQVRVGQIDKAPVSTSVVFSQMSKEISLYNGLNYRALAQTQEQFPQIMGEDKYYGGTAFENSAGLGVQVRTSADLGQKPASRSVSSRSAIDGLTAVLTQKLYDRGTLLMRSYLLHPRLALPVAHLHAETAAMLGVADGEDVQVQVAGQKGKYTVCVSEDTPQNVVLLPNSVGALNFVGAQPAEVVKIAETVGA
ncbi:MAG TPA: NADH-quinone oxidoreductase subunit NuoG [Anaerolineales bacterium]|nr:NADH-quinone oxidoreductase subunit NuoG [Anaerolineales bacterium]